MDVKDGHADILITVRSGPQSECCVKYSVVVWFCWRESISSFEPVPKCVYVTDQRKILLWKKAPNFDNRIIRTLANFRVVFDGGGKHVLSLNIELWH